MGKESNHVWISVWILGGRGGLGVGMPRERNSWKKQISEAGLIRQQKAIKSQG